MDKIFWCVVFIMTVTFVRYSDAESRRFRRERFRSNFLARQEFAGSEPSDNAPNQGPYPAAQAPYPAAGYRPALPFNLPTEERRVEQEVAPVAAFIPPTPAPTFAPLAAPTFAPIPTPSPTTSNTAAPVQTYGAPPKEYGPPPVQPRLPEFDEPSGEEPVEENDFEAFDIQGNQIQRLQDEREDDEEDDDDDDDREDTDGNNEGLYYVQLPMGLAQKVSYVSPSATPQMLSRLQLPPVVQTHQPLVVGNLVTPKSFSYTSQYQSW